MRRFDVQLVKSISSGRCFLIVGAGASVSVGYPTWKQLASVVYNSFKDNTDIQKKYENKLENSNTDELLSFFDDVENLVGREALVNSIQEHFKKIELNNSAIKKRSDLYSLITHWPISCYITTNWDSEIKRHLPPDSPVFLEKGNSDREMRTLTADCPNTIFKIHGSFKDPSRMIITSNDYNRVKSSSDFITLREKLYSTLSMCPVVIIGYSAQDPDFKDQLERAKSISSTNHPVYMFSPDCDDWLVEDMLVNYNIRIIPYDNRDGLHAGLLKLLRFYNSFIALRNTRLVGRSEEQLNEGEDSAALLIYTNTVLNDNCSFIAKALANVVLNLIKEKRVCFEQLQKELKYKGIPVDESNIRITIDYLVRENNLGIRDNEYYITPQGVLLLERSESSNNDIKERFFDYCKTYLLDNFGISNSDIERILKDINKGLELLFKKRGLEIARNVINEEDRNVHLSFDILDSFLVSFDDYPDELFENYVELLISILQTPSKAVRDYFAILCNGYFTYYVLGFSPDERKRRLQFLIDRDIFLDSNFLISLLANYSFQNVFYVDLLDKLRKINPSLKVTRNLLREVVDHAFWAITNYSNATMNDFSVYHAELGLGNIKQNMFIDGAINYCSQTGSMAIKSYFEECFGPQYSTNLENQIIERLNNFGIMLFDNEREKWDQGDLNQKIELVKRDRLENDSFRKDFQCETEGELLYLSEIEPFAFITSAMNLQRLDNRHRIKHWSPELLYRLFQINDSSVDFDNLYNCMVSDIYNCGMSVLPKEVMDSCSKKFYEQADINYEEVKREAKEHTDAFLSPKTINDSKRDFSYPLLVLQSQKEVLRHIEDAIKKEEIQKQSIIAINTKNELDEKERVQFQRMINAKKERQKKMNNKRRKKKKKK